MMSFFRNIVTLFAAFIFTSRASAETLRKLMNEKKESLCTKYTTALFTNNTAVNQETLVTLVVNRAVLGSATINKPTPLLNVPGILADGEYTIGMNTLPVSLAKYFNGSIAVINSNGLRTVENYLDGGVNQASLLNHLYQYFGAILGCTAEGFPAYEGDTSMYEVHKFMNLNPYEVGYFIQQVGMSALSFGVSAAEVKQVGNFLTFFFGFNCLPPAKVVGEAKSTKQSVCAAFDCPLLKGKSACQLYQPTL